MDGGAGFIHSLTPGSSLIGMTQFYALAQLYMMTSKDDTC